MKIAICEDEKIHLNELYIMINSWSESVNAHVDISAYNNAEALLAIWGDIIFDVLILDIEMKKMNGMELAKTIRRVNDDVSIIFVTSHTSYSIDGYDVNPLHYLTKPLSKQKFHRALDKAYAIYQINGKDAIIINSNSGLERIVVDKVNYMSIFSHDVEVVTQSGIYKARVTLKELMAILPSHFIQCHRSYIINMMRVRCVFRDHVVMQDDIEIPVSKSNSKQVKTLFMHIRTR